MSLVQPPVRFHFNAASTGYNADGSVQVGGVSAGDEFQCAEIGPLCDLNALYLFTDGEKPVIPPSKSIYTFDPFIGAKYISVGSPWVGPFKPPIIVVPPNAAWWNGTTRDSSAYGFLRLDMLFHRCVPLHVMRRRPDGLYRYRTTLASGDTAAGQVLNFPTFGREDFLLNINSNISTSGTITIRIYGATAALGAGSEFLLDTIAITTAGPLNNSREYEGKFDTYAITMQGATMADAASTLDLHVRTRDKY